MTSWPAESKNEEPRVVLYGVASGWSITPEGGMRLSSSSYRQSRVLSALLDQESAMTFLRIDKLQIELPVSGKYDPNAAAAVQELMGGRFGEMSILTTTCISRWR